MYNVYVCAHSKAERSSILLATSGQSSSAATNTLTLNVTLRKLVTGPIYIYTEVEEINNFIDFSAKPDRVSSILVYFFIFLGKHKTTQYKGISTNNIKM